MARVEWSTYERMRLGADYKLGPSTSVGPMLGATLTLFETHRAPGSITRAATDPEVCTFLFVGVQGRFEIGGRRVEEARTAVARR